MAAQTSLATALHDPPIRFSAILASVALTAALHPGTQAGPEVTKPATSHALEQPHSFIDAIEGFARDTILYPNAPFELVPGKNPNGWSFTIEPYLWAMGVSGDVGVKELPPIHARLSPKKILQSLDWGLMGKGEVRNGRWGILGDGLFAQLSASGNLDNRLYNNVNITMQQGFASLAMAYRIIDDRRGFLDLYAGARYNYLGIKINTSVNNSRVDELSDTAATRIVAAATSRAKGYLASNPALLEDALASQVKSYLTESELVKLSKFPKDLDKIENPRQLRKLFAKVAPEVQGLARAVAAEQIALASNTSTDSTRRRVTNAQGKLSAALAEKVENALPTHLSGDVWWVDPIVGLRGQINFTRWLFLAAQGDVGGFGAGSQLAWNAQASLGVNFTRNFFGELGYRCMYTDYAGGGLTYQVYDAGVFSGIGVKF